MRLTDSLRTATRGLRHAKVRSALTMLGIVIGIASVILLMSIGTSAQRLILSQVQGIGSNLIFIIPGATKGSRFASPPSVQGVVIKTLVKTDLVEAVRGLKQAAGSDLVILGSGTIVSQLAQAGLVDVFQVVLNPLVLGQGRTMFEGVDHRLPLKLTDTRRFTNGNVVLTYEPAGG